MPLLALRFRCHARTNVGEVSERSASAMCVGWLGGRAAIDSVSHGGLTAWSEAARPRFLAFWQEGRPRFLAFGRSAGRIVGTRGGSKKWHGHKSAHLGRRGRNGSSRHLTLFGTQFRAPARRQQVEGWSAGAKISFMCRRRGMSASALTVKSAPPTTFAPPTISVSCRRP